MPKELPIEIIERELYEKLASKELSFGCRVESTNFGKHNYKKIVLKITEDLVFYCDGSTDDLEHFELGNLEIIGHEPTLNDILLALRKSKDVSIIHVGIHEDLLMYLLLDKGSEYDIDLVIDLTRSFDAQDESVKRKLHSLLFNNPEK